MATRGRHDRAREFFWSGELAMARSGVQLPVEFEAKLRLLESFSPKTLNDDNAVRDWIDMFTMWPQKPTPGIHNQLSIAPQSSRLPAYQNVTTAALVIGFADDIVLPAHLGREVANALPNGRFLEISDAGHLGFIEKPQVVNTAILEFFADTL